MLGRAFAKPDMACGRPSRSAMKREQVHPEQPRTEPQPNFAHVEEIRPLWSNLGLRSTDSGPISGIRSISSEVAPNSAKLAPTSHLGWPISAAFGPRSSNFGADQRSTDFGHDSTLGAKGLFRSLRPNRFTIGRASRRRWATLFSRPHRVYSNAPLVWQLRRGHLLQSAGPASA